MIEVDVMSDLEDSSEKREQILAEVFQNLEAVHKNYPVKKKRIIHFTFHFGFHCIN